MQGTYFYPLKARPARKLTLEEDEPQNIRDKNKPPPVKTHLYFTGSATVEIGKASFAAGAGFPVLSDATYVDDDSTHERWMLATGDDAEIIIQEFDLI